MRCFFLSFFFTFPLLLIKKRKKEGRKEKSGFSSSQFDAFIPPPFFSFQSVSIWLYYYYYNSLKRFASFLFSAPLNARKETPKSATAAAFFFLLPFLFYFSFHPSVVFVEADKKQTRNQGSYERKRRTALIDFHKTTHEANWKNGKTQSPA